MATARVLNSTGIKKFENYLINLKEHGSAEYPARVLQDDACTEIFEGKVEVNCRTFDTKFDAAEYLYSKFGRLPQARIQYNRGLWAWLALFYFEAICPVAGNGDRRVGESVRYIPPAPGTSEFWQKYYRHLLAGPYRIYYVHKKYSAIFLQRPVHVHGELSEQLASRQDIIANTNLIKAVDRLYVDRSRDAKGIPKSGITSRDKPGTLRRLVDIVQQLELTYDLYCMSEKEIINLLPREFDRFRSSK